jgi:hypothetical protein
VSRLSGWPRSATARLAMLSLATILACVGIVLGVVYAAVDRQINSDAQALVEEDRSLTRALIDGEERQTVRRVIAQLLGEPGARGRTLLVTDDAGQVIAGNIAAWPAPLRVGTGWHAIDLHRQGVAHAEMVGLVAEALPDGGRLLVGHALYARERVSQR